MLSDSSDNQNCVGVASILRCQSSPINHSKFLLTPEMQKYVENSAKRIKQELIAAAKAEMILESQKNYEQRKCWCYIIAVVFTLCLFFIGLFCYHLGTSYSLNLKQEYPLAVYSEDIDEINPDEVADYALESSGAEIIDGTESRKYHILQLHLFSLSIPYGFVMLSSGERAVLQPKMYPGECWAFSGNYAAIKIKLSHTIIPQAVTVDHITEAISPSNNIDSAPRHFSVFAVDLEDNTSKDFLGHFEYKKEGPSTQTFRLSSLKRIAYPSRVIEFQFQSNHGHPDYTCVYKIRVHGQIFKI